MSLFDQRGQHVGTQYYVGGDININHPLSPAEQKAQKKLRILLKRVEKNWLEDVLDKSLYNQVLLSLGKELKVNGIDYSLNRVFKSSEQKPKPLPPEKKIKEIFLKDANRLLLILGEPGSGKTITLLQLARELINDLKQAPLLTEAIPVIFNLSTWPNKKVPLTDWLVMELQSKYVVPQKLGRHWLEEQHILPLLDGLDEVKEENRAACVEQINQLKGEYGFNGMVVCSRSKEYDELVVSLDFNSEIHIKQLTNEQIEKYFKEIGEKLTGLRQALSEDKILQELAHSPLMLNVMSLAYQDRPVEQIIAPQLGPVEARRSHLFDIYIERTFQLKEEYLDDKEKKKSKSYIRRLFQYKYQKFKENKEQIKDRLAWLAWNMREHNQEIFLIEGLQPSWLIKQRWHWAYILASRWITLTIIGMTANGIFFYINDYYVSNFINIFNITKISFFLSLLTLFLYILKIIEYIFISLLFFLIQIIVNKNYLTYFFSLGILLLELLMFFLIWLIISWIRVNKQNLFNDIQPVETLIWSRPSKFYIISSFVIYTITWISLSILMSGISSRFIEEEYILMKYGDDLFRYYTEKLIGSVIFSGFLMFIMSVYFLPLILMFLLYSMLKAGLLEEKIKPNQGIRLSIKNALKIIFISSILY